MQRLHSLNHLHYLEIVGHVCYWLFHFTSVNTSWGLDWTNRWDRMGVAQLTIVLYPIIFYINAFWLIPKLLKRNQWYKYLVLTFVLVLVLELTRTTIFVFHRNDWEVPEVALWNEFVSKDNLIFGLPNSLAFAFAFSTIYRFTRDWIIHQRLIAGMQKEKITLLRRLEELESSLKAESNEPDSELSEKLVSIVNQKRRAYPRSLQAKRREETYVLRSNQIAYLRAQGDFVLAFDSNGDSFIVNQSISYLEESLDPTQFFRINRSEIVNSHFLEKYSNHVKNRLAIHLRGIPEVLYTSNTKTPDFRQWLEEVG